MTDAAATNSVPQVRVCASCGRPDPPHKIVAHGRCMRCDRRWRRGTLGLAPPPPNPLLAELTAARRRTTVYDQPEADALADLRATIRLAYSAGLSGNQIADLTGYSAMGVNSHLLADQRRRFQPPAPPELVAEWAPSLADLAAELARIRDHRAEAQRAFLEFLTAATRPDRPDRVGLRRLSAALGVPRSQIQQWQRTATRTVMPCQGSRADGERCRAKARRGRRTCWRHADQEPSA